MEYTTNQKGLITEMEVMLYFIKLGYNVSQPLNTESKYDCIVDINNKLYRIQIKTAHLYTRAKNAIEIKCRSITTTQNHLKEERYTSDIIDFFATVWENEVYLIPVAECGSAKVLHLTKENVRTNCSYLEDYKAKEMLEQL